MESMQVFQIHLVYVPKVTSIYTHLAHCIFFLIRASYSWKLEE